jgi:signal peptide peptidase SppA
MTIKNQIKLLPSLWAIHPDDLAKVEQIYADYLVRETPNQEALFEVEINQTGLSKNVRILDNVGVLTISGVIVPKNDIFVEIFGGAPLDTLTADFKSLMSNEDVDTIVLDIDSPGGSVTGVAIFADMIFQARSQKRIITHSSSMMMSAAMWIGAAAEKILISDNTVTTGSIGVLTTHLDMEIFNLQRGVVPTEIVAGKKKRIASQLKPLTSEGRAHLQSQVNHLMDVFVGEVARFKGVTTQNVSINMADGDVFIGDKGVQAGLIDDIISFDLLMENLSNGGDDMSLFAKNVDANLDNLKEHHVALYNEAVALGVTQAEKKLEGEFEKSEKVGFSAGEITGQKNERARIEGINKCTIVGQEKLAAGFVADGATTPGEAAIAMINADKEVKTAGLETIKKESASAVGSEVEETIKAEADKSPKDQWAASADLQKEFPDVAVYESYMKNNADGNVRVFSQTASK